jgi:hypothetical protein
MSIVGQVQAAIDARQTTVSGLSTGLTVYPIDLSVSVGDCEVAWSERRTIGELGYDEVDFATIGVDVVKLLCVKNLSADTQIALTAGWNGSQFANFRRDTTAWNFSPMINLGNLTLRGYPIRESGSLLLSCPNSDGFGTTAGGSILRIGGTPGKTYEIYVLGT